MKFFRKSLPFLAIFASSTLLANTTFASTISKSPATQVKISQNNLVVSIQTLRAVGTLLPALIGTILTAEKPKNVLEFADKLEIALNRTSLPADAKPLTKYIVKKLRQGDNDFKLPDPKDPNKPIIQEFLYPTLAIGCNNDGGISLTKALVTAGPQKAPAPGPKVGEAGVVLTALGSGKALNNPRNPLSISWWNFNTFQTNTANLLPNPKINPQGPGTFTQIVPTGKGKVIAVIFGNVTTKNTTNKKIASCTIIPTIGLFDI